MKRGRTRVTRRSNFRLGLFGPHPVLVVVLAIGGVLWMAQPASASTCMQDVYQAHGLSQTLNCTANDVRIAEASNIRDVSGNPLTQCISGQTFNFIADFRVVLTAKTRYDIGLYFAVDGDPNGDGALTGSCSGNVINPFDGLLGSPNFINLDPPPDTCGDINAANNPQIVTVRVNNVLCQDSDGDGFLNLPNCTSWRQPGSNEPCTNPFDAFPGSPSKCNCDIAFNIPVLVETGTIEVTKSAAPASRPEPGGPFTFTVGVTNTALYTNVTLERICDDQFGLVAKIAAVPSCPSAPLGPITGTTCTVPQTLAPGGTYSCTFTADVTSSVPKTVTDIVTVYGRDQNNTPVQDSDSAQVVISDVPPAATVVKSLDSLRCVVIRYKVRVNNTSAAEPLDLSQLADSAFGNIASVQGDVVATICAVPQTIAAGGNYECTFDARFCGASHVDTVTASLNDDEGSQIAPQSNELTVNVEATTGP